MKTVGRFSTYERLIRARAARADSPASAEQVAPDQDLCRAAVVKGTGALHRASVLDLDRPDPVAPGVPPVPSVDHVVNPSALSIHRSRGELVLCQRAEAAFFARDSARGSG